jgi:hypothetical protein
MLKQHPYEDIDDSDRAISGTEAAKMIQKYIDKKGYNGRLN